MIAMLRISVLLTGQIVSGTEPQITGITPLRRKTGAKTYNFVTLSYTFVKFSGKTPPARYNGVPLSRTKKS